MKNNLIGLTIGAAVAIIVLASVLVPVTSDAQERVGDPVTLNNNVRPYYYEKWEGEDLTAVSNGHYLTINDVPYSFEDAVQYELIASDVFCCRNGGSVGNLSVNAQYINTITQYNGIAFTFAVHDGEYTLDIGTEHHEGAISWMFYITTKNTNLSQLKEGSVHDFYLSNAEDLVILGNIYTTGDNDTFYAYYDGKLTVKEEYADVSSVEITKTKLDGYLDAYTTNVTVHVGDESFTPYYILAPTTVIGHEHNGSSNLIGVIPMLVILAVLLGVVGVAVRGSRD